MSNLDNSNAAKVYADSLPESFCHYSKAEALDDAIAIACFLQEAVSTMPFDEMDTHGKRVNRGMGAVCALMIDKLKVASGELAFPEVSTGQGAPTLTELLEAGQATLKAREGR